jgi:hypothetical protein
MNDWLIYYGAGFEYFVQSIVIGNLSSIDFFFNLSEAWELYY